jgi:hypothetical protein
LAILAILARDILLFIFAADHLSTAWSPVHQVAAERMGAGMTLAKTAKIAKIAKAGIRNFVVRVGISEAGLWFFLAILARDIAGSESGWSPDLQNALIPRIRAISYR